MLPALVLLAGLPLWLARELTWWWTVAMPLALLLASLPDRWVGFRFRGSLLPL